MVTFNAHSHYEIMKIKLLFFSAILFLLAHFSSAQTPGFLYSSIRRPVQNKQDSLVLIRNEQKMWMAASKGNVQMYDNAMFDCEFKVRMSKAAIEGSFQDSIPLKSGASFYMINLMENRNADTCYTMSFSPFLNYQYQEKIRWIQDSTAYSKPDTGKVNVTRLAFNYGHWEMGKWQTGMGVRFLIPLSEYPAVIPAKNMAELNKVYRAQFASQLRGKLSGDTIFRTLFFTVDSNEYLPQAPYANLILQLQNNLFGGDLHAFPAHDLKMPMSKRAIEVAHVGWDSTNQLEDPNNPGVFILAPLRYEGRPKSFVIYEKWIPFTQPGNSIYPSPHLSYRREIVAYGLRLTNESILWLKPTEVIKVLAIDYNFTPYEECFRAERFKTLQIQVPKW